ncbi:MAG: Rieske 2Fe-2S domain-containing protein [Rhodoferax sp.]
MQKHSAWLRDCWYVIAWDHEIPPADSPELFHRIALGEPILVYRLADGRLAALEDRCCHRLAPLSQGRREGDSVRCGYHGLMFNQGGACVEAPGIAIVPEKAKVKTYPVAVKNKWVFVWMGNPALADEALLPDNFSNDHPEWQNKPGYLHYDTPYLLICDNLLDFSHLSFVHASTLGGSTQIAQAVPVIEKTLDAHGAQNGIKVTRRVPNVPAPPFYQRFRQFDEPLDRWFIYDFQLPGTLLMHSGGRPASDAATDLRRAVQLHSCQTLTPETESSTHYFFQQSHYLRQEGGGGLDEGAAAAVTESIFNSLKGAFNEDRDMIRAQHANIQLDPSAAMLPLAMDSALMQFRRLLASRLQGEAAQQVA